MIQPTIGKILIESLGKVSMDGDIDNIGRITFHPNKEIKADLQERLQNVYGSEIDIEFDFQLIVKKKDDSTTT